MPAEPSLKINKGWIGLLIIGVLSIPVIRVGLEDHLVSHVLIELPLLVAGGALIGQFILECRPEFARAIKKYSLAVLLTSLFTFLYWMLPQSLDASLADPVYTTAKFISLPVLLGIPLSWSGLQTSPVTKAFIVCNLISMLLVLGWLYTMAPIQLCNYYLQSEQKQLGGFMLALAGLVSFYWVIRMTRPAR